MTIALRKSAEAQIAASLVEQVNALRLQNIGSSIHQTKSSLPPDESTDPVTEVPLVIDAPDAAVTLATVLVLANQEKRVINAHFADTIAHDSAVSAAIATVDATDQTTANTLLNDIKAAYNTHRSEANVHFTDDTGNVVAATASDLGTSITLANEIKTDGNAHMALALAGANIQIIGG